MPQPAIVSFLADYGFYEIFLPFILVFTIIFSVIQKTNLLGKEKKRLNIGVALAVALTAVGSLQFSGILQGFVAKFGFALVILLGIALFLGFMGVPLNNKFTLAFAVIAFLGIVYAQFSNPAIDNAIASFLTNGIVIAIIVITLIIYLFVRSPGRAAQPTPEVPRGKYEEVGRIREGTPEMERFLQEGSDIRNILNMPQQRDQPPALTEQQQAEIRSSLDSATPQDREEMLRNFMQNMQQGFQGIPPEERAAQEYALRYLIGQRRRRRV